MNRPIPSRSGLRTIPRLIFTAFVFIVGMTTAALAQHAGGHVGVHVGGAGRVSAPPAPHPAAPRPVTPIRPPIVIPAPRNFVVRSPAGPVIAPPFFRVGYPAPHRPILPPHPIRPIFTVPPSSFVVIGVPFFGLGFGWGFNLGLWPGCNPVWGWTNGCYGESTYEYTPSYSVAPLAASNPLPEVEIPYYWPVYYGEPDSQYVALYLDDGTAYFVTDYWLVNGELHFKTVEEHGTKVVEHTIDFDRLDLQKTIDVNTDRGFRFVLRNESIEQYLKDHPSLDSPDEEPAEPEPDRPE